MSLIAQLKYSVAKHLMELVVSNKPMAGVKDLCVKCKFSYHI